MLFVVDEKHGIISGYEAILIEILNSLAINIFHCLTSLTEWIARMPHGKHKTLHKFSLKAFCSHNFQFILMATKPFFICLRKLKLFHSLSRLHTLITLSPRFKSSHNVSDGWESRAISKETQIYELVFIQPLTPCILVQIALSHCLSSSSQLNCSCCSLILRNIQTRRRKNESSKLLQAFHVILGSNNKSIMCRKSFWSFSFLFCLLLFFEA